MTWRSFTKIKSKGVSAIGAWSALQLGIKSDLIEPIHTWAGSVKNNLCSAQFRDSKVLHNGNLQERIITVLDSGPLCMETCVYSPSGELLKAYAGIREDYTIKYARGNSVDDVGTVVAKIVSQDKDAKSLLFNNDKSL